ncbi:MAG TPA: carbohydrate ABC transporter permease [Atribacteraceae bacterium]|nr:carbohydrate ABC transporter permease [Atribacteraceae bacterium]
MNRKKNKRLTGSRIVVHLIPILVAVATIFPFIFMGLISLQDIYFISGNPARWIPRPPTLGTFAHVVWESRFLRWTGNSVLVAASVTVLVLIMHSMAGYIFAKKRFPHREIIFTLILAGIMVPRAVTIIPAFLTMRNLGLLNTYPGLIFYPLALPIGVFLMRQFMLSLPDELIHAAKVDGCSEMGAFFRVALPLSKPALAVLGIYTFMEQWRDFLWPLVVAAREPVKTLPVGLSTFHTEFRTNFGIQMAASLLSVLPILIVFLFFQRYFIKGLTAGALKE